MLERGNPPSAMCVHMRPANPLAKFLVRTSWHQSTPDTSVGLSMLPEPPRGTSAAMDDPMPPPRPWHRNGASGPFGSLSSSLGKKLGGSADNLLAMAAEAERKIKNESERIKAEWNRNSSKLQQSIHRRLHYPVSFEDWPHAADRGDSDAQLQLSERKRGKMRRVRTFDDFRRGSRLLSSNEQEEGRGWDLAAAVNNALSKRPAPGPGTPLYLVAGPVPSLKDQVYLCLNQHFAFALLPYFLDWTIVLCFGALYRVETNGRRPERAVGNYWGGQRLEYRHDQTFIGSPP